MIKFYAKIVADGSIESTIESDNEELSETLVELTESPDWSNKPSPYHKPYYQNGKMVWQIKESDIRDYRNKLLIETDWTQLGDVPKSTSDLWVNYRQKLRDIPQQSGYPFNVIWPTKPL